MSPPQPIAAPERARLSLDLAPSVLALLDHISEVTGVAKSQIVYGALLDAMADLVERADAIKKRQVELAAPSRGRK
jgi:hypothetical protein